MSKPRAVHPFLFAIFPIVFLLSHNVEQVSYRDVLFPAMLVLGLTLLAFLSLSIILRNSNKAAFFVSISLLLFFSYGHVYDLIQGLQVAGHSIGRHPYLLLVWAEIFASGVYWLPRSRIGVHHVTKLLNIVSLCLVVFSLLNIGLYELHAAKPAEGRATTGTDAVERSTPTDTERLPDIYYIILDGYASSQTLNQMHGYDNGPFTDSLAERGFYVAHDSRSNYPQTFLSLASSLNMEYVNDLTDVVGEDSEDRAIPYRMIKDSSVLRFLRSSGYRSIHFRSGWGPTFRNHHADLNIHCGGTNEFTVVLLRTTMIRPLERDFAWSLRERVLCTFSELATIPTIDGPKFVFAHILSPHPPFLFGRDGEPVSDASPLMTLGATWEQEDYLNQLMFVNTQVESLVDEILSESAIPPIIILQADHGPATSFRNTAGAGWHNPTDEMLRERTSILNAYHLPGVCSDLLYDSITPVNTFRLIFNCYFETDHRLLDDEIYFCSYKEPYEMWAVTDTVTD